ncbi:MAG: OprO/OprP family phosphate-selective porin [Verrucomicrobiia bacterium]
MSVRSSSIRLGSWPAPGCNAHSTPGFNRGPALTKARQRVSLRHVPLVVSLLGRLLIVWMGLAAHAGDTAAQDEQPVTNRAAAAATGPAELKKQINVTAETNPVHTDPATNAVVPKKGSFSWSFSCDGWDGIRLELTRRTLLGELLPGDTNIDHQMLADELGLPTEITNRYRLNLEETRMTAKIGGKLALDAAAFVTTRDFDGFDNGAELRRARIYAKGDCLLLWPVSYQLEVGYIPNEFYIEESYLAFKDFPRIGVLKVGQYQAPMGLDIVSSARDITFMEPAAPLQALAPGVNAGLQLGRPVFDQRATWTAGLFTAGEGHDFGDASKNYGRVITRFTGLPIFNVDPEDLDSTELLHIGLSANILYSGSSSVRYRSRPESHLAPHVVDTGEISADGSLVVGAEAAWVDGPFSVQGEFLHSWVRKTDGQVPGLFGFYASAGWFLTGESRPYDVTEGVFGRVIPRHNFNWGHGGWGAWELAGRYSFVNLNSADLQGGRLSTLMAGVNWYLHPHVKCRLDYGYGEVSGHHPEGYLNIVQTRVEIDF